MITNDIPEDNFVKLDVYDIKCQKIAILIDDFKEARRYKMAFDGLGYANCEYFLPDQSITFKLIFNYKEKSRNECLFLFTPGSLLSQE